MIDKSDILRKIDNIKTFYQSGEYRMFANFDILMSNMEKMMDYYDVNDLWEETTYGVNESVSYICLCVLMRVCVIYELMEDLTDCDKFYNFVKTWFRDNYDFYEGKKNTCYFIIEKCAEEISKSLKN